MSPERWRQVETVFQAAADLKDCDRAGFLEHSCRGDEELRLEVESLLSVGECPVDGVQQAVRTHAEAIAAEQSRAPIGQRIGAYRVIELIGRGGMGAVYLAARDGDFQHNVAIKLIHHGMASDLFVRCFRRERQILALLSHPYVARLHDAGATADGRPYLVMEYVPGRPITEYCDDRRLGPRERVALFLKVCEAVTHAHRNLVVHRDIKPENILVTDDGIPKLLDFGVAKLLDPALNPEQTRTFVRMLTPYYASPEQIRGEPPTTAMDIYSLGAVLYHLLTGARAHRGTGDPPSDSEQAVWRGMNRNLAPDLKNIVMMALRSDPACRYRSVEQFSDDLGRYLSGRPVIARQDSVWYRAGKYVRRNAVTVCAATAVAVSLVVGAAVSTIQAQRAQRRFEHVRQLANVMLVDLNDKVRVLPGSLQSRELMVKTGLEYLDGLFRESGMSAELVFDLARGYERVAALQASPDPAERTLGRRAEGLAAYRRALELAELVERQRPNSPDVQLLLVNIHLGIGSNTTDIAERERSFDRGLVLLEKVKATGAFGNRRWEPDGPRLVDYLAQVVTFTRSVPLLSRGEFRGAVKMAGAAGPDLSPIIVVASLHGMGDLNTALENSYAYLESRRAVLLRGSDDILTHLNRVSYARASMWIGRLLGDGFAPHLGDPARAREVLARGMNVVRLAIERDPQDPGARRVLQRCELALADTLASSDPARAVAVYAPFIDAAAGAKGAGNGPSEPDILWKIAYPLMRLGRNEEALNRARHAARATGLPRAELAMAEALAASKAAGADEQFRYAIRSAAARVTQRLQDMHARNDLGVAYETYAAFLLSQGDCLAARKNLGEALNVWREWTRYGVSSAYNVARETRTAALQKRAAARPCAQIPH